MARDALSASKRSRAHVVARPQRLTAARIKSVVDAIVKDGNEMRDLYGHDEIRAEPLPAIPKKVRDALMVRVRSKVPAAYRQFLSVYDGVNNFDWVDLSLFGAKALAASGPIDPEWADAQDLDPKLETFIFGQSGSDSHVVAFTPNARMAVIDFDSNGLMGRYKSFDDYLRRRRRWFGKYLRQERGGRGG